jgi:phospholipid/cholesterol/gamma-HCH transport system substrate-binding protein
MPRTRSLAWSELKIGLLTLVALVIATGVIFLLSGEGGFFWQRYALKARFPNAGGLKTGAPVRLAGVEVGSVTAIDFSGDQVDVTFELSKNMRPRVTDQSVAIIGSVSLLGESALDIKPATAGTPIPDWGYVKTARTPGQLADVSEQANLGLIQATELLKDIRAGKGTLGKLVTDDALYREVTSLVDAANTVAGNLRAGRGTLGRLNNDPAAYEALKASLENLQGITDRINSGEGSLGQLLKDDAFANTLNSATRNIDGLTARLNRGEGTAGKLLTDDALYKRIDTLTARLDEVMKKLSDGPGTASQLLNDRQLYDSLNKTIAELGGLVADIRKDPRKYLRVKVSIF